MRDAGARIMISSGDDATLRKPGPKSGDAAPIHMVRELWRPRLWRLVAELMLRDGGYRMTSIEGAETFEPGDVLDVPGSPRVIATPGHTAGHCALHFERHSALFVGDAMCSWNLLTGKRGPQLLPRSFNVSTARCLESLSAIQDVDAEVLLPGHGGPWRHGVSAAVERARTAARH
jgi:glyoxylase-like metal-dependent hydrolase (beta-lactamase superfamily II)